MKLIFLDIDGVLNDHEFNEEAQSSSISYGCVEEFNRIIHKTGAKIVLSSAWRYQILLGAMTFVGFEYLLRTHGVTNDIDIIGATRLDHGDYGNDPRGHQIAEWLSYTSGVVPNKPGRDEPVESYVVLDDGAKDSITGQWIDLGLSAHPWVRTNGNIGLTSDGADSAIAILMETRDKLRQGRTT